MSAERAWDEYLAWTRGADPHEYALTEARAWERLQADILRAAVVPIELEPPTIDPDQDPYSPLS